MTDRWLRLIAIALFGTLVTSCSSKQVREESYTPTPETIRVKSEMPIAEVWDRWDEKSDSHLLVDGKHLIAWNELPTLLADDKSSIVLSKVDGHRRWQGVSILSATTGALAGLFALIGYAHNDKGERNFSIPAINILWGISAASIGTAITSHRISEQKLRDAIQLHNEGIRSQPPAIVLNWEGSF